jgi:site-specific recombinase XerD
VAALTRAALDGDAGALRGRGKSARHERLPLPQEVGEAFAVSLRHHRPPSLTRQVVVRMRAPRRGLTNGRAVTTIVARALRRAGLKPARKGAHLLRPSFATPWLHHGASLTEIGALVRPPQIETTRLSATVDPRAVGALAWPWPGGEG